MFHNILFDSSYSLNKAPILHNKFPFVSNKKLLCFTKNLTLLGWKRAWCPRGTCSDFAHRAFMLLDNLVLRWVAVNIWFLFTHIAYKKSFNYTTPCELLFKLPLFLIFYSLLTFLRKTVHARHMMKNRFLYSSLGCCWIRSSSFFVLRLQYHPLVIALRNRSHCCGYRMLRLIMR